MKKFLVVALLLGGAYAVFGGTKKTENNSVDSFPTIDEFGENADFLTKYNNQIVIDVNGYWSVIENGKLRPASNDDLALKQNTVKFDVWRFLTSNRPDLIVQW